MKKNTYKCLAVALSIIWVVSAAIGYVLSGVAYVRKHLSWEANTGIITTSKVAPFIFIFCYLFPLLLLVKKCASQAGIKSLVHLSKALIAIFILMLFIMLIAFVLML